MDVALHLIAEGSISTKQSATSARGWIHGGGAVRSFGKLELSRRWCRFEARWMNDESLRGWAAVEAALAGRTEQVMATPTRRVVSRRAVQGDEGSQLLCG